MTSVENLDIAKSAANHARIDYSPRPAYHRSQTKTLRVALAGCGVVGGALVRLLEECGDAIEDRHGLRIEIARVLVRDVARDRGLALPHHLFTNDVAEFAAEDVDVVIEAIGGVGAAKAVAHSALAKGRRFISANKELIADSGCELAKLARESSASLDFGAAVGGSAPVISLLRDLLGNLAPARVRGILNGTSNYVLTQLELGRSFDDAVVEAQARGLAEADIARDLDGRDPAAKLAIIAWISFGIAPSSLIVRRISLPNNPTLLVKHARELGCRVRLIAECITLPNRQVCASVEPVLVPADSVFARTQLEDNRVEVDLGWAAPLSVSGPGAGGRPTATSLLTDILSKSNGINHAGPARIPFTPIDDPRVHRWLLVTEATTERSIISATWKNLEQSLSLLEYRGIAASAARIDESVPQDLAQ